MENDLTEGNSMKVTFLANASLALCDNHKAPEWILFLFDIQNFLWRKDYWDDMDIKDLEKDNFAFRFELLKNFFLEVQRIEEASKPIN